jgi:hypothetical protein
MRRTPVLAAVAVLALASCSSSTSKPATASTSHAAAAGTTMPAAGTTKPSMAPSAASDAAAVVARLKAAGLPVDSVIVYTAETDPNHLLGRPGGYLSKAGFADTRIDPKDAKDDSRGAVDLGGDIEVFADAGGANARADYIRKAMAAMPMLGTQYEYVSGPVLLRLSQVLTPDQAAAYQKALG